MSLRDVLEFEQFGGDGMWEPMPKGIDGEILVAWAGNPEYIQKYRRLEMQHRKFNAIPPGKELSAEDGEMLTRQALIGTLLKGWRGLIYEPLPQEVLDRVGSPPDMPGDDRLLPFSEGNAKWLLGASTKFRQYLLAKTGDETEFEQRHREAIAGNSPTPSSGTTGGSVTPSTTG